MLGIADRSKVLELFKEIFAGDQKKSINLLRTLVDGGIEPLNLLNDFLEIIYFMIRKKNLGDFESDLTISKSELEAIDLISKDVNIKTLTIFWQFIVKGIEEMSIVSNQILALEMIVFRLIHLHEMPDYQEVINLLKDSDNQNPKKNDISTDKKKSFLNFEKENKMSVEQIKNVVQTKSETSTSKNYTSIKEPTFESVKTFEQLIQLVSKHKEIELKYDLERNVNLVKFSEGKIDINFSEKLGKNFIRSLSEKLFKWTGKRWVISLTQEKGSKTYTELKLKNKQDLLDKEKKGKVFTDFKKYFPDAELIEIKKKD